MVVSLELAHCVFALVVVVVLVAIRAVSVFSDLPRSPRYQFIYLIKKNNNILIKRIECTFSWFLFESRVWFLSISYMAEIE